jgi:hypothetical protein
MLNLAMRALKITTYLTKTAKRLKYWYMYFKKYIIQIGLANDWYNFTFENRNGFRNSKNQKFSW